MDRKAFLRWSAALAAAPVLGGCAQRGRSALLLKDEPLLRAGQGLILASLGYKTTQYHWTEPRLTMWLASDADGSFVDINTSDAWGSPGMEIVTRYQKRVVLAYPALAGRYRMVSRGMVMPVDVTRPGYMLSLKPKKPFPLEVKAGEITYLGYHEFEYYQDEFQRPARGSAKAMDLLFDDLARLQRLRPETRPLPVHDAFYQDIDG